ncbi:hypothetical protein [Kineosporia sp. NBRC 101731]|uniref:hypothetical protein n=1 Tax=Kineosporia sp. NBRC 101731 TaxID=3032199 RepID=UPI0024A18B5D|nr:hypothetical protein [Kineosporia sp. NBRC 101731]GLY32874.1 hypothetical protein Kisp02_62390 [Kineosporia sp. NBRC 101731]
MRFKPFSAGLAVAVATVVLVAAPVASAHAAPSCTWGVTSFDLPAGLSTFDVSAADGDYIAGMAQDPDGNMYPVLWRGGSATVLETSGGSGGYISVVNADGMAAGGILGRGPVLWSERAAIDLATPAGAVGVVVRGITDAGQIIGNAVFSEEEMWSHGIVWSVDSPGEYRDLGAGSGSLELMDVDDDGTMVAVTSNHEASHPNRTTTALKGTATNGFSPLPRREETTGSSVGQVAGEYALGSVSVPREDGTEESSRILWHNDTFTTLPSDFDATSVNKDGAVSGFLDGEGGVWRAGSFSALPTYRPGIIVLPLIIKDDGVVVGTAISDPAAEGGRHVPVLWTCS